MEPLCRINTRSSEKSLRVIRIPLNDVFKDIDGMTFKYVDGNNVENPQVANAVQSDSDENLDGHLLARSVQYRDASLRTMLTFALADGCACHADSSLDSAKEFYIYKLMLPVSFNDALLEGIAAMIHRYLVYGALCDWYGPHLGNRQFEIFSKEISHLEEQIQNTLRTPSRAKRPMQPFGPASKKSIF